MQADSAKLFYDFDSFRIDVSERFLLKDAEIVPLAPKAFDTLLILVQNYGRTVPKADLMKGLWPDTFVEDSNLVNNISILRKALGDGYDGRNYIQTFHKRGYRFVAKVRAYPETSQEPREEIISTPPASSKPPLRGWRAVAVVGAVILLAASTTTLYSGDSCVPKERQSVTMNSADEWTVVIPVLKEGVRLERDGVRFEVQEGDEIRVNATGAVDVGRGKFGPDGDPHMPDSTMDSTIKDHVGGLELWVGSKDTRHYHIGSKPNQVIRVEQSGVPTFRVIESLHGYCDKNNSGTFAVTVRRLTSSEQRTSNLP